MKAIITSIGESTRNLCIWSLERNGFEVVLYESGSPLADKLKDIYNLYDEDFVRIDADVVPNRKLTPDFLNTLSYQDAWWLQFQTFGWFTQDAVWGGIQYIRKQALPILRDNIDKFQKNIRPETAMTRLPEFYKPRRFESHSGIYGIHGYAAKDIERVKQLKMARNQYENYDWDLGEKLLGLL